MADAIWKEIELYCPVCDVNFKQLVVLHKLPKNFKIEKLLSVLVKQHDHQAYQAARKQADSVDAGDEKK